MPIPERLLVAVDILAPVLYWARCEAHGLETPNWSLLSDEEHTYHRLLAQSALELSQPQDEAVPDAGAAGPRGVIEGR